MRILLLALAAASCGPPAVTAAEPEEGFVALFDGRTLDGWVTRGGRYDGDARWTVEDGAITGRQGPDGAGGLLYTACPQRDFELHLEVRLDEPLDSGVFVRMAPRGKGAQVTLDVRPGGEVGAIYSDGFLLHNEGGRNLWRSGAWNDLAVRCAGEPMEIEARLNGAELVRYRLPAGAEGYAPTGLIGLQVHGGEDVRDEQKVQFRNVRLRAAERDDCRMFRPGDGGRLELTDWGRANGWRPLLEGDDLGRWQPHGGEGGFALRDGELALLTEGGARELRTAEDFRDFDLRLDFKIAEMANSGLFLRGARTDADPAYSGCEVQILDDFHWEAVTGSRLKPWQHTGSLYGALPPGVPDALRPLGEWNAFEVSFRGARLAVRLNGRELYDVDTHALAPEQGPPFAERAASGFLGIQRHAPSDVKGEAYAWFRNAFVRAD